MSPIKLKNVLSRKTISACGVFSPSVLCHLVVQLFPCCFLVVYSVFTLWLSYETKVGTQHPTYWCCHLASLWNLADVFAFGSVVGKHLSSRLLTQQLKVPPVASFRTSLHSLYAERICSDSVSQQWIWIHMLKSIYSFFHCVTMF